MTFKPSTPGLQTPVTKSNPKRDVTLPATVQETDPTDRTNLPLGKTRSDFQADKFTQVIRQKGYYVIWRKALLCPCRNAETDQVAMNCDFCSGSGFYYMDPQPIQAIMTRFEKSTDLHRQAGLFTQGETSVTVEPQYRLGWYDSIEMRDSLIVFNEWIEKGDRSHHRRALPDGEDTGRYRIVNMNAMTFLDTGTNKIVRLKEGLHFNIERGRIVWLTPGNELVVDGTTLSIHYDFRPIYVVTNHPHAIREEVSLRKASKQTVVALPIQASVKLDFMEFNGEGIIPPYTAPDGDLAYDGSPDYGIPVYKDGFSEGC